MSGFSPEWLGLREPVDLAARNRDVETAFLSALPEEGARIMDLASGAGSTVAALADRVGPGRRWLLTDNDPVLLGVARRRFPDVDTMQIDLARELDALPFREADGITTSAFLDLVTEPFLEELVVKVTGAGRPFLASLTYDGRALCRPADPFDEDIRRAMNAHQKTDKGFGAALGPDAASVAGALFSKAGCQVVSGESDWQAGPDAAGFLRELLGGWVSAAIEMGLDQDRLKSWHEMRLIQIGNGELAVMVGHVDFAAIP
jgi:SAM-dependent methyltransferase